MKKIILLIGLCILIVLVASCSSSFKDCMYQCKVAHNMTFKCALASGLDECFPKDIDALQKQCYNECKPK